MTAIPIGPFFFQPEPPYDSNEFTCTYWNDSRATYLTEIIGMRWHDDGLSCYGDDTPFYKVGTRD